MEQKSIVIKLSQNERYCSKCKKVKNEKEFGKSSSNKIARQTCSQKAGVLKSIENTTSIKQLLLCKECANVKNEISIDLSQDEKYCSGCKSVKDENNFSSNQDWCKECKSNLMKKYYEKNINHHRATVRKNYESKQVKTVCECGRTIYLVSLKAYLKTKIHMQMLEMIQQIKK